MIVQVTSLCVAVAMICAALRTQRPELATAVSLAGGLAALGILLANMPALGEWVRDFQGLLRVDADLSAVVLKGAGIAVLSEFGCQLCADAGESALSGRIALAFRLATLGLCLPMISEIAGLVLRALS